MIRGKPPAPFAELVYTVGLMAPIHPRSAECIKHMLRKGEALTLCSRGLVYTVAAHITNAVA